jgi:hypothetical protein
MAATQQQHTAQAQYAHGDRGYRAHSTPEPDIPPVPENEPTPAEAPHIEPDPSEVPQIDPVPIQDPMPHQVPIRA